VVSDPLCRSAGRHQHLRIGTVVDVMRPMTEMGGV